MLSVLHLNGPNICGLSYFCKLNYKINLKPEGKKILIAHTIIPTMNAAVILIKIDCDLKLLYFSNYWVF